VDNPGHPQSIQIYTPSNVEKALISNHSYTPSSSGGEPPLIGCFGLLNDDLPLCSILDTDYPNFYLHLTEVLYDVVLPSMSGSSSWSRG